MKNLLFEMLSRCLGETDFRLKKSEKAFFRTIPGGWQKIGMAFWDCHTKFQFSPVFRIRLDAVEEIYHLFSRVLPQDRADSATTIRQLKDFIGKPDKYEVRMEEDVAAVEAILCGIFREKINPFFNGNMDVKALDRTIHYDPLGVKLGEDVGASMHAIIVSHLAANPDFDTIVARHRSGLKLPSERPHAFNQLVEYLKTH